MNYLLLVDVDTKRIVWFTSDLTFIPQDTEEVVVVEYDGELPQGLIEKNSWSYVYREGKLVPPSVTVNRAPSLLEHNRIAIKNELSTAYTKALNAVLGDQFTRIHDAGLSSHNIDWIRLYDEMNPGTDPYAYLTGKNLKLINIYKMRMKTFKLLDSITSNSDLLAAKAFALVELASAT